jgi:hypothetical protein
VFPVRYKLNSYILFRRRAPAQIREESKRNVKYTNKIAAIYCCVMPCGHNDLLLIFEVNSIMKVLRREAGDITPQAKQTQQNADSLWQINCDRLR